MGLFIGYTIIYMIIGFIGVCIMCPYATKEETCHIMFFWPLIFIKWSLKQLFNILFKDWKD